MHRNNQLCEKRGLSFLQPRFTPDFLGGEAARDPSLLPFSSLFPASTLALLEFVVRFHPFPPSLAWSERPPTLAGKSGRTAVIISSSSSSSSFRPFSAHFLPALFFSLTCDEKTAFSQKKCRRGEPFVIALPCIYYTLLG